MKIQINEDIVQEVKRLRATIIGTNKEGKPKYTSLKAIKKKTKLSRRQIRYILYEYDNWRVRELTKERVNRFRDKIPIVAINTIKSPLQT